MANEVDHPHDGLFRKVFSDVGEAVGLLRTALPGALQERVDWTSLKLLDGSFVDENLRQSQTDLLYEVAYGESAEPVWLYVLLEHQSTPDARMSFRMLKYCCRIWDTGVQDGAGPSWFRPIVPMVFYQGRDGWTHSTQFADLFPEVAREWSWVPRFAHLLLDQTNLKPDEVEGAARGRVAQWLMMAAYGRHVALAMDMAAQLLRQLRLQREIDYFELFVLYVMATQDTAGTEAFDDALRRHGHEQGGMIMSYAQQLLAEGEAKGRVEGERLGQLKTVEGFLRAGVSWDVIEEATGLNESGFKALKERLSAAGVA